MKILNIQICFDKMQTETNEIKAKLIDKSILDEKLFCPPVSILKKSRWVY